MAKIETALISLSDKTGIIDFAEKIVAFNVNILSTGGTAGKIREAGIKVTDVSDHTGFPEMMNGRVKTLHPKIHGGLLGLRSNPEHVAVMKEHGITNIDMVVVNLYPFKEAISKADCTFQNAIENIDIGGPAMLRSAAKNFESVTVIIDPMDYESVLKEMDDNKGVVSIETNFRLAAKVYQATSQYDKMIADYLANATLT